MFLWNIGQPRLGSWENGNVNFVFRKRWGISWLARRLQAAPLKQLTAMRAMAHTPLCSSLFDLPKFSHQYRWKTLGKTRQRVLLRNPNIHHRVDKNRHQIISWSKLIYLKYIPVSPVSNLISQIASFLRSKTSETKLKYRYAVLLPHACYTLRLSGSSWSNIPSNSRWFVADKLGVSPSLCRFLYSFRPWMRPPRAESVTVARFASV
jgi:hypothetical protein